MRDKVIVFVTGSPGTGKTYLASKIIENFPQMQLISYDAIKEEYWDKYGFSSIDEKRKLDNWSLEFFYTQIEEKMVREEGIITDYPLYQRHRERLKGMVSDHAYKALTVLLYGDKDVIYARAMRRDSGRRHPGHFMEIYHKNDNTKSVHDKPKTKAQFWDEIKDKNYDIGLGKTIMIDVTEFDNVNYKKLYEIIEKLVNSE